MLINWIAFFKNYLDLEPFCPGARPFLWCLRTSFFLLPLRRMVFVPKENHMNLGTNNWEIPVGALRASWSKVRACPPAATILSLALVVNLKAQMVSFGTVRSLSSLVTVETVTMILFAFTSLFFSLLFLRFLTILERETGHLLLRLWLSLLSKILLNLESVLLAKKVYNCNS